jgi:hypothetical protein
MASASVSSQFAASNTSRPALFVSGLVPALLGRLRALGHDPGLPYPLDLCLLTPPSSASASASSTGCPPGHLQKHGVVLQVQYRPALDLPTTC